MTNGCPFVVFGLPNSGVSVVVWHDGNTGAGLCSYMLNRGLVLGNLAGMICMLVWAANFPLAVSILKTWDALGLAPVRMLLAGVTVLAAALLMRQTGSFLALFRSGQFIVASLVFGISALLFVIAQARIDAVAGAVIVSAMPLFSALMGWIDGTEKPGWRLAVAIVLTVTGGVLISLVSAQGTGQEGSPIGIAAMLVAVVTYVWYSREMVGRYGDVPDLAKTAASMVIAGLLCMVIALFGHMAIAPVRVDLSTDVLIRVALLACISLGLSSVLWLWAGRLVGITVAAMHHNLVPFYVILLAAAGGAIVTGMHIAGALLVIAGAVIAQFRPRRKKAGITQPVPPGR